MTLEEMKELELHDWDELEELNRSVWKTSISCTVQRVPNGWNYIYEKGDKFTVQFVPELLPIQQYNVPRSF